MSVALSNRRRRVPGEEAAAQLVDAVDRRSPHRLRLARIRATPTARPTAFSCAPRRRHGHRGPSPLRALPIEVGGGTGISETRAASTARAARRHSGRPQSPSNSPRSAPLPGDPVGADPTSGRRLRRGQMATGSAISSSPCRRSGWSVRAIAERLVARATTTADRHLVGMGSRRRRRRSDDGADDEVRTNLARGDVDVGHEASSRPGGRGASLPPDCAFSVAIRQVGITSPLRRDVARTTATVETSATVRSRARSSVIQSIAHASRDELRPRFVAVSPFPIS